MTPAQFLSALDDHEWWLSSHGLEGKKAVLENVKVSDVVVSGRELSHASFAGSKFVNVSFRDTNLAFLYAARCQWHNVDLSGSKLTCVSVREGMLVGCDFTGCDMYFATMTDAIFKHCTFDKTLLKNANLTNSKLTNSPLDRAYLCDTILTGATLRDTGTASVHHLTRGIIKR